MRGRRGEAAEVKLDGVVEVERRVGERLERLGQRWLERPVHLDHVQMLHPRREVLAQHAEAAAHLEHHVACVELGGAADHAEDVVVDEEVLPELAVGPDS